MFLSTRLLPQDNKKSNFYFKVKLKYKGILKYVYVQTYVCMYVCFYLQVEDTSKK